MAHTLGRHAALRPPDRFVVPLPFPGSFAFVVPLPLAVPAPFAELRVRGAADADVAAALRVDVRPATGTAGCSSRMRARNVPVWLASTRATSSGVPSATTVPPPEPPSGPMSTTQSALLI